MKNEEFSQLSNVKSTLKKPASDLTKKFDKNFDQTMNVNNVDLQETDKMLNEKEHSLKKKIFNLAKMEALVHNDQKLSAIYNKMSEDGEEKYGYHYNETIMNMIFNEYVINSVKYLEKYKNSIPKEKKRRDKSGIKDLQMNNETQELSNENIDETTSTGSAGNYAFVGPFSKARNKVLDQPLWDGGQVIGESNYIVDPLLFKKYYEYLNKPNNSLNEGISEVNIERVDTEMLDRVYAQYKMMLDQYKNNPELLNGIKSDFDFIQRELIKRRTSNQGNPSNSVDTPIHESHLNSKEEKVAFIIRYGDGKYGDIEKLDMMQDQEIDRIYQELENKVGEKSLNEDNMGSREEKINYMIQFALQQGNKLDINDFKFLSDDDIDMIYNNVTNKENKTSTAPVMNDVEETTGAASSGSYASPMGQIEETNSGDEEIIKQLILHAQKNGKSLSPNDFRNMSSIDLETMHQDIMRNSSSNMPVEQGIDMEEDAKMVDIDKTNTIKLAKGILPQQHFPEVYSDDELAFKKGAELMKVLGYNNAQKALSDLSSGNDPRIKFYESSMLDTNPTSMVNDNQTSMKMKQEPTDTSSFDMNENKELSEDGHCRKDEIPVQGKSPGTEGSCRKKKSVLKTTQDEEGKNKHNLKFRKKNTNDYMKKLEDKQKDYEMDLIKHQKHMDDLKESVMETRKPSALILLDRLKKANGENFESQIKDSNLTDENLTNPKENEYSEVKDPFELGEKIEKESLNKTKGEALKNNGDSTNDSGDEIPKRNHTEEEQEEVMLNRGKGMQDLRYDGTPSKRFEERMKEDMGEEIYKNREKKMEYNEKAPMYNKDKQPVTENIMTGKYINEYGKTKYINFRMSQVEKVSTIDETYVPVYAEGLGNTYNSKLTESKSILSENEEHKIFIKNFNLFTKNNKMFAIEKKNSVGIINENETSKGKENVNEGFEKFKHLTNYNSSKYTNIKIDKKKI